MGAAGVAVAPGVGMPRLRVCVKFRLCGGSMQTYLCTTGAGGTVRSVLKDFYTLRPGTVGC